MQTFAILALLVSGASASDARVTPVQKVLTMLSGMMEKSKKEKHEEQVQFAAYKTFCEDTEVEKTRAIEHASEAIDKLKADIANYKAEAQALAKSMAKDDKQMAVLTGDMRAARKVRKMDHADYQARARDFGESVEAVEGAIEEEEQHLHDVPQASLAQVDAKGQVFLNNSKASTRRLNAYIADYQPAANSYESHSGGLVDTLEGLDHKFIDKKKANEEAEMNSKHAFDMLMQDVHAQMDVAQSSKSENEKARAGKLQKLASAKGDLEDTTVTKAEDSKYLSDLKSTCEMKAADFETRQQLRAEEIESIETAIGIIGGDSVSGNADKHLPSLLQKASSMAQIRSGAAGHAAENTARYLLDQAKHLNSQVLSSLATRIQSGDPFDKVKRMVKDLIVRLMEQASEEAEHKGWCDTELSTNEQTRKEKSDAVETLHAELDELDASIAKLAEEIRELSADVAELDKAIQESTELRQAEKAKNTETVQDARAAQEAVAQALEVLREFYAKAAESTALLQEKGKLGEPEVFDKPYKGSSESGGVVGMLEVIESDFARLEADTISAESTSQQKYDKFMQDSRVDKASKSNDIEHKESKKQGKTSVRTSKLEDLDDTQKELDAALAYFEKLKPSCVDSGVSYEDRVQRRKAEIESLQEALRILEGEEVA